MRARSRTARSLAPSASAVAVTVAVDVARAGVRVPVSEARVRDAVRAACRAERVSHALVSVAFVTRAAMARMNREYLGHAGATDVITFSMRDTGAIVGDVYIAPEVARANAHALRRGVREEILRLVVHGTLHVLGHRHPDGPSRECSVMWARQERIVARLA